LLINAHSQFIDKKYLYIAGLLVRSDTVELEMFGRLLLNMLEYKNK